MKYKSTLFYILLFIFSISLYGCSTDKSELNEISLVVGMGIDKMSSDNSFVVTLEIINPNSTKDGNNGLKKENNSIIQTSTGNSIFDAIQNFSKNSSALLDFSHAKVIILSKELCESQSGVSEVMDYLNRNRQIRSTNWILISNKPAKEILKGKILNEASISNGINTMMSLFERSGSIVPMTINNFIIESKKESNSAFAPVIDIEKSKDSTAPRITVEKMAIFKNNRLIGILTSEESKNFFWMADYTKGHTDIFPLKSAKNNINITASVFKQSTQIIPHLTEEGFNMEIRCKGSAFIEQAENIDISPEDVSRFEYAIESVLKDELNKLITKSQKNLDTDFIGFSTKIYNNYPKKWFNIKKNWDKIFPNMKYEISFEIKLTNIGIIKDPVMRNEEETTK
ncbi:MULTISPECIES: Ger(x)C family spore germination protein [Clostridium]|uniref:Predicted spore germination protein n=2 Tax=Clostridium TaxID=1485 RepID=D8GT38_CLOLD|nr:MULTISPECIES: Ger(x)C family spore germination protein [Clostridium]ADK16637.1 predicted spore germination protein [Clostridium ljungdahlii DSM 13528]AGY75727.1 Ger(x)C family spore germination protein [Clostridium autoethanogenum DSM 10061]ALU35892.1 Germination protein Ger(x)C family [Clostridium autoethanogenum DSM 10061]OAA89494.1 Spore germination protein B3 precursor [Clostridium ljungdahlii DSM 13528]OVY52049.1 Spore germination protein B3 precursor [Clostridium autoethanogenum]